MILTRTRGSVLHVALGVPPEGLLAVPARLGDQLPVFVPPRVRAVGSAVVGAVDHANSVLFAPDVGYAPRVTVTRSFGFGVCAGVVHGVSGGLVPSARLHAPS